jgi:maltose/moltooligosaccharide transporter
MGLFNVFIVVPQLLVATVMGSVMKAFFPGQPVWTMLIAALVMTIAAVAMLGVETEAGSITESGAVLGAALTLDNGEIN